MSETKRDLYSFIDAMPEMYAEKALIILSALIQPTGGEVEAENMERWLAETLDSKERIPIDLSAEKLKEIEEDEIVSWDNFKEECSGNGSDQND